MKKLIAVAAIVAALATTIPAHADPGAAVVGIATMFVPGDPAVPVTLTIARGSDLVFVNVDAIGGDHTLTSLATNAQHVPLFNTGNVPVGGTKSLTITVAAGTYPFYCAYHATMKGTLVVTN